jgi:hypothetical protein
MNLQGYPKLVSIHGMMAYLAKLVGIIIILQVLQIALASPDSMSKQRKITYPVLDYVQAPAAMQQVRRGGVLSTPSAWPKKNLALDSTCQSYASYLAAVFDNIEDMVRGTAFPPYILRHSYDLLYSSPWPRVVWE